MLLQYPENFKISHLLQISKKLQTECINFLHASVLMDVAYLFISYLLITQLMVPIKYSLTQQAVQCKQV